MEGSTWLLLILTISRLLQLTCCQLRLVIQRSAITPFTNQVTFGVASSSCLTYILQIKWWICIESSNFFFLWVVCFKETKQISIVFQIAWYQSFSTGWTGVHPPLRFSWPSVEHWEGLELYPVDTGSLIAEFQIVFRSSEYEQLSEGKPNTKRSHMLFL